MARSKRDIHDRADDAIEEMLSTGAFPVDQTIEAAQQTRRRVAALLEQSDRYLDDRLSTFSSEDWLAAFTAEVTRNPEQELFTLVRIVDVPDGAAPLEIREQWVGTVLITTSNELRMISAESVLDPWGESTDEPGYITEAKYAISTLQNDGKSMAADWWERLYRDRGDSVEGQLLVFDVDCAELVTLESAETT